MRWLWITGAVSAALYAAAAFLPHWGQNLTGFAVVYGSLILLYVVALATVRRQPPGPRAGWGILAGAVVFRAAWVGLPPYLSDDLYRYLWDGRVFLEGINPYRFTPTAEELLHLREGWWPLINHPELPTIYPPMLMLVFAGAAALAPGVLGWKLVVCGFDLLAGFFLMKGLVAKKQNPAWALLYLWHPLVVLEFAGGGHADAVGICLLALAFWWWAEGRGWSSGTALALAGLVKFLPWVALPVLARRLGIRWLLFPAGIAVVYLLFWWGGVNPLGSLEVFAAKWRANDFLFGLWYRETVPSEPGLIAAKRVSAAVAAAVWLAAMGRRASLPAVYGWTVGAALLVSPLVHPWYVIWLLPAVLMAGQWPWWVWSLTVAAAYAPLPAFLAGQPWSESTTIKLLEYLPVFLGLLLYAGLRAARRMDRAGAKTAA